MPGIQTNEVILRIVYEDAAVVVVDKPSGLLAVPGRGPDKQDCVVNRLRQMRPQCIPQPAAHRLDMDTSGLMVLGLTAEAQRDLSRQFAERRVKKLYLALLEGIVSQERGEIRLPFRLDPEHRPRQVYDPLQGKWGLTHWQRLACDKGHTLMLFRPHTGRTHQLRLHASHPSGLGCPIVGDRLYGSGSPGEPLLLHSAGIVFFHPHTGQSLSFFSPAAFCPVNFHSDIVRTLMLMQTRDI